MSLDDASVSPQLYYTNDHGPDNVTLTPLRADDPEPYMGQMADEILYAYGELLRMLEENTPGSIRLQCGLAAAAAGLSVSEFFALSKKDQDYHRTKFVKVPLHHQLAPSLILYLGPKQNSKTPSASGRLSFNEKADLEFWPWHSSWEEDSKSFTAWRWSTRTLFPQHLFIFLSGAFLAWPNRWKSERHQTHFKRLLQIFLKITIYHELAHQLQNLVCIKSAFTVHL